MSYLSLSSPRDRVGPRLLAIRSPRWHYCPANLTDLWSRFLSPLYPAQQQLYMVCIPHHYQFVPYFLDVYSCASRLCLSHLRRVCVCFAWTLYLVSAIRFSHVTSHLLLDYSLLRLLISPRPFLSLPPFKRHIPYQHPKKANDSPTLGTPFPHPVFSPLCRPYPIFLGHGLRYAHLFARQ